MDVEEESLERRRLEDLIATSLYKTRANRIKEHVRELYKGYGKYLKTIEEVRFILSKELPDKRLSQEIVDLRRRELH
jgi:hypothetical protein